MPHSLSHPRGHTRTLHDAYDESVIVYQLLDQADSLVASGHIADAIAIREGAKRAASRLTSTLYLLTQAFTEGLGSPTGWNLCRQLVTHDAVEDLRLAMIPVSQTAGDDYPDDMVERP